MELVRAYTGHITADTLPKKRLERTKVWISDIRSHLNNGGYYGPDTVAAIIKDLLKVALDRTHTEDDIRAYIISPVVCQVVQSLITGPVTASDVLRGITGALEEVGVGFDRLYTWSALLVCRWFVRVNNTICPTSPGFVSALFEYFFLCADRQEDVCGNRNALYLHNMDTNLLPLIEGALLNETADSINMRDGRGETPLHHASSIILLPQVTATILSYKYTDINARNNAGKTALTELVIRRLPLPDDPLPTARHFLGHHKLDVSVLDTDNKSALDHCLDHLDDSLRTLPILRLMSQHQTCTSPMIQRALEKLVDWEVPSKRHDLYTKVINDLAGNVEFDVNTKLKNDFTLAHIAAIKGDVKVLLIAMETTGFDPNIEDRDGNTPLYYACAHLSWAEAKRVIHHLFVRWNFTHKNLAKQTVLDYCRNLPGIKEDLIRGLEAIDSVTGIPSLSEGKHAADQEQHVAAAFNANKTPRAFHLTSHVPVPAGTAEVHTHDRMFRMTDAEKGKACQGRPVSYCIKPSGNKRNMTMIGDPAISGIRPSVSAGRHDLTTLVNLGHASTGQITADTLPMKRLDQTKVWISDLRLHINNGGYYGRDKVAAIIKDLLRFALDRTHTDTEIRDYITSPDVFQVVQSLITGPVTASDVLRGMTQAVVESGVGFDRLYTWSAVVVYHWFVRADHTVCPTSPGFVSALFEYFYLCADRQEDVCGNRNVLYLDNMDYIVLKLIKGALLNETADSINMRDRRGETSLHHASSIILLPQVTAALLACKLTDANTRNKAGKTALTELVIRCLPLPDPLPTARELLGHLRLDVAVVDYDNKTALDHCLDRLDGAVHNLPIALAIQKLISQHPTCTSPVIQRALEKLVQHEGPSDRQGLYAKVMADLASNKKYDINSKNKDGMTLAHIAAIKGKVNLLLALMETSGFDPDVEDLDGNTPLYYACGHIPWKDATKVIDHEYVTWDFTHRNCVNQTVLDYCRRLPESKMDPMISGILELKVGESLVKWECTQSAVQEGRVVAGLIVNQAPRAIRWTSYVPRPAGASQVHVQPSTWDFVNSKQEEMDHDMVFRLTGAKKGKACIICVSSFLVHCLSPLDGYIQDSKLLAELWTQMGYDVMIPRGDGGDWHLTAVEMNNAMREFCAKLESDDESAVVCLLSHGKEGYLYGSDGKTVSLQLLLKHLDNKNCVVMKKKPKVIIIQACAGESFDYGTPATHSSNQNMGYSSANEPPLPTTSDRIICTAALPGYASYVRDRGSVFIEKLVEVFSRNARKEDIHTLMTWVNKAVAGEDIPVQSHANECKQMSRVDSCLTKLLFFFPCKDRTDWCPVTYSVRL